MSLILPAFSSPDLKAFPLHLRHCRSSGSAPSLPNLPRAGRVGRFAPNGETVCFVPLRSTNPTDSPDTRISVEALVVLSDSLCLWRKDPYLPSQPFSVRHLPRPTGLPPMAFAVSFRIRFADAKTAVKHHRPERTDGRFRIGAVVTVVPRPTAVHHGYIYIESVRRYSCYFTALLPMCIRLT